MTEQQITEFDRWFEQRMDPELNLTPGDKELCRHAWKAALSHAEWEAVGTLTIDRHGDEKFHALLPAIDLEPGTYEVYTHPAPAGEQPVSDPDGLPDRVLMPRALTAKNGAKEALMGEFDFSVTMTCPECHPDDPDPDCEVCDGSVEYEQPHTVPWTTIKRIYTAAVDLLAAPAPDEREIAALREDAERYRFWREVLTGDDTAAMDLFEEELNRDVASGNRPPTGEELDKAVDVARRLRAGKEGE